MVIVVGAADEVDVMIGALEAHDEGIFGNVDLGLTVIIII